MAQKAKKELAKSNIASLKQLHLGSLILHIVFVSYSILIRRRSILAYIILSIPSFIAEFVLERSGRPRFDKTTQTLKSSGEDLGAPGLTEYLFDIVWITWICLVLVVLFGDWGWLVYGIVPVYGLYKGYGFLGMAKGLVGGPRDTRTTAEESRGKREPPRK